MMPIRLNYRIRNHTIICYHRYGRAPIATRGDGAGPDRPLGVCRIYWDPIERPRRKQSLFRARHSRVVHRGAYTEP